MTTNEDIMKRLSDAEAKVAELTARAEKAEAEVARLRDALDALVTVVDTFTFAMDGVVDDARGVLSVVRSGGGHD